MTHPTTRTHRAALAAAASAAMLAAAAAASGATTLTWDANLAQAGAQGGAGTWAAGAGGWFNGTNNVTWNDANRDSAVFGGAAGGVVTVSGTTFAKYVTFNTPGYTLSGGTVTFEDVGTLNCGVHANVDVTINSNLVRGPAADGWSKDGPGTLTLGGGNANSLGVWLQGGAIAFASGGNLPGSVMFGGGGGGDGTGRLRYVGADPLPSIATYVRTTTVGTIEVPGAATQLSLTNPIDGTGLLVKQGAGALRPTAASLYFTGTVRVDAGTLLLTQANLLNGTAVFVGDGTVALRADAATTFASPLSARGTIGTIRVDRLSGSGTTGATHTIPGLDVAAGATVGLASANGWGLTTNALTNAGTIDLNTTRLVYAGPAMALPAAGAAGGTIRFGHGDGATDGFWVTNRKANATAATFAGQGDDASLRVVAGADTLTTTTSLLLDGAWRGGGTAATSTIALTNNAAVTFGPNFRANDLTADRAALRPFTLAGSGSARAKVTFDPAFVADHTAGGAADDGLGQITVSNATWVTQNSLSLPAVSRPNPGGAAGATHRAGLVTFENVGPAPAGGAGAVWEVASAAQTYDGGVRLKADTVFRLTTTLTLAGRNGPYADNAFQIDAGRALTLESPGAGRLNLTGDLGFAPGSRINTGSHWVQFDTDPGAGWYAGNYARAADGTLARAPAPGHTLGLHVDAGAFRCVFNAPVCRVDELYLSAPGIVTASAGGAAQRVLSVGSRLDIVHGANRYLDLTNNAAVLRASQYHTVPAIGAMVLAGDVRSSTADAAHALGYARAADVLAAPAAGGTYRFLGLSVAADDVLVRYTLAGDATLDGAVDFEDLVALAQNYNSAVATAPGGAWVSGDFTGNGVTDFDDLVRLAQNYNSALTAAAAAVPGASANFDADLAAAFASVPEPSALSLALLAACGLSGRRRPRRVRGVAGGFEPRAGLMGDAREPGACPTRAAPVQCRP